MSLVSVQSRQEKRYGTENCKDVLNPEKTVLNHVLANI